MLIEKIVYSRLSSDATLQTLAPNKIFPTTATLNTNGTSIVYQITNTTTSQYLDEVSTLETHNLLITGVALNMSELNSVMQQTKTLLHGWRSGQVLNCILVDYSTQPQEGFFLATQNYSIAQDTELLTSTISITRGNDCTVVMRNLTSLSTGNLINNAVVEGILYEADETTEVYDFTLTYTGTPGRYLGVIPGATTATLMNSTYHLEVTATAGGYSTTAESTVRVR